ncbi:hypothetical protein JOD45_001111 [Scopulibacillus daqui]|uniref:Uncharacterized protein n=1 Tax=Scopulibacillus daqui TaxID=1469162 RepID=A0ABS2Q049_9BACL|nr:hypothetical protein [Scopulibacillus daqui]MBM7644902.1 hypothetical protein [Scopulibacillus daqui]
MFRKSKPFDLSPYDHPDIYPGPRPVSSFIFYKGKAHKIEETYGTAVEDCIIHISERNDLLGSLAFASGEKMAVKDFLKKENAAPITDRIPLLGYGSNVCLAQLAYKFGLTPDMSDLTICFRAAMKDSDIVFGSFLAPYGALPAIIAPVSGTETEIWLTLVDQNQFDHMNSTEGGYGIREHRSRKCILQNGERFEAVYGYYHPRALKVNGDMIRFKDIPGTSPLPGAWEADILNWLKGKTGFDGSREHFIHKLRWDYSFHCMVNEKLKKYEYAFDHPDLVETDQFKIIGKMKRDFVSERKKQEDNKDPLEGKGS